jgi:hypothetical protein
MDSSKEGLRTRKIGLIGVLLAALPVLLAGHAYLHGQDKSDFPEGFDAVQAAPGSHKVIFENALVRVLEVTVPAAGTAIPMHHHRWPSFFLDWDTGGATPHIRYHRPDGSVKDHPSVVEPLHAGAWSVQWMKPEPMHEIEVVDKLKSVAPVSDAPSSLRIEIKCHP